MARKPAKKTAVKRIAANKKSRPGFNPLAIDIKAANQALDQLKERSAILERLACIETTLVALIDALCSSGKQKKELMKKLKLGGKAKDKAKARAKTK